MGELLWAAKNKSDDSNTSLGKKIFGIDFNNRRVGYYTKEMHTEDFYTYEGEDLYFYKNHDGSWMYGLEGIQNASIVEDNTEKVLRIRYPKGKIHPGNGLQSLNGLPKNNRPTEDINNPQEVTLVYYIKFENDFDWAIGGKIPGLAGGTARAAGGQKIGSYDMQNSFTARFMWHMLGDTAKGSIKKPGIIGYIYHPGRAGTSGQYIYGAGPYLSTTNPANKFDSKDYNSMLILKKNKWYKIQQTIKANRPYKSDGTMKVWINGEKAADFGGMKFIANGMHGKYSVDRFLFSTFYGGGDQSYAPSRDTHIRFKDISVYIK